jgi:hypothetical protein
MPREMFVNGVVEYFENAVMQPAFIGVSDVHSGPFADGFQPLELIDFRRIIFLRRVDRRGSIFHGFKYVFVRHNRCSDEEFWAPVYSKKG